MYLVCFLKLPNGSWGRNIDSEITMIDSIMVLASIKVMWSVCTSLVYWKTVGSLVNVSSSFSNSVMRSFKYWFCSWLYTLNPLNCSKLSPFNAFPMVSLLLLKVIASYSRPLIQLLLYHMPINGRSMAQLYQQHISAMKMDFDFLCCPCNLKWIQDYYALFWFRLKNLFFSPMELCPFNF